MPFLNLFDRESEPEPEPILVSRPGISVYVFNVDEKAEHLLSEDGTSILFKGTEVALDKTDGQLLAQVRDFVVAFNGAEIDSPHLKKFPEFRGAIVRLYVFLHGELGGITAEVEAVIEIVDRFKDVLAMYRESGVEEELCTNNS